MVARTRLNVALTCTLPVLLLPCVIVDLLTCCLYRSHNPVPSVSFFLAPTLRSIDFNPMLSSTTCLISFDHLSYLILLWSRYHFLHTDAEFPEVHTYELKVRSHDEGDKNVH
jgi:hypothetical protein